MPINVLYAKKAYPLIFQSGTVRNFWRKKNNLIIMDSNKADFGKSNNTGALTGSAGYKFITVFVIGLVTFFLGATGGYLWGSNAFSRQFRTESLPMEDEVTFVPTSVPQPSPTPAIPIEKNQQTGSYRIKAVNLQFHLPPELENTGRLYGYDNYAEKGSLFCVELKPGSLGLIPQVFAGSGCFPNDDIKLIFGGVSPDFEAGREGGFMDHHGYVIKDGKYFAKFTMDRLSEIPQEQVR